MAEDIQSKAADLMKKVLTAGVGAVFLTEESLRALVSEFKLPKELLAALLESAAKTKNEFLSGISREVVEKIMSRVDTQAVIQEFLSKHEIQINLTISAKEKKS